MKRCLKSVTVLLLKQFIEKKIKIYKKT